MGVEHPQAGGAGSQQTRPVVRGGPQRGTGQPPGHLGAGGCPAWGHRGEQFGPGQPGTALGQGELTGQQVRRAGQLDVPAVDAAGQADRAAQQGGLPTGIVAGQLGLQQHQAHLGGGMRMTAAAVVDQGLLGVPGGGVRVAVGERCLGRGAVKRCRTGCRAGVLDHVGQGVLRGDDGLPGQPGGQQHGAAIDRQIGFDHLETGEQFPGQVEHAQRPGQVALGMSRQPSLHADVGVFGVLPAGQEELLRSGMIAVGPPGLTQGQMEHRAVIESPCLPEGFIASQQFDGLAGIGQPLVIPADEPEHVSPADQDPAPGAAAAGGHRVVQGGQGGSGASGERQGDAETRGDIEDSLTVAGCLGPTTSPPQFGDRFLDGPVVAEHDADRLVGGTGQSRLRSAGEHFTSGHQGTRRVGQGQGQQLLGIGRGRGAADRCGVSWHGSFRLR